MNGTCVTKSSTHHNHHLSIHDLAALLFLNGSSTTCGIYQQSQLPQPKSKAYHSLHVFYNGQGLKSWNWELLMEYHSSPVSRESSEVRCATASGQFRKGAEYPILSWLWMLRARTRRWWQCDNSQTRPILITCSSISAPTWNLPSHLVSDHVIQLRQYPNQQGELLYYVWALEFMHRGEASYM